MTRSDDPDADGQENDRTVSRRVHNPTAATRADQAAYPDEGPATDLPTDTESGGSGGAAERAAREVDHDDEPTRSE